MSLTAASNRVSTAVTEVSRLLKAAGLPEPTCEESGIHDFDALHHEASDTLLIRQARNELINATQELTRLAMGPVDQLCSLTWSASKIANLGSLIRLDIPKLIPLGGSRPLGELVAEIGLPELITTRLLRYAVTNGIFQEDPVGVISHTAASARLATDHDLYDFITMWASEPSSLLVKLPETLARKQSLGQKGPHSAANIAFPEYVDLFDYFGKRVDAAKRYSKFLAARANIACWSAKFLKDAWDWESVGSKEVVDIGGSAGTTSFLLAEAFPSLHLVNQDISPEALEEGRAKAIDKGYESRISFVSRDFFSPQNISAKAYLLKSILHDWSDEACMDIIRAILPALGSGSHVLVIECIMPEPPALRATAWDYEAKRVEDQLMIAGHGAHERTLEQYQALFRGVSSDFHFNGATTDAGGSVLSLMDFEYRPPQQNGQGLVE